MCHADGVPRADVGDVAPHDDGHECRPSLGQKHGLARQRRFGDGGLLHGDQRRLASLAAVDAAEIDPVQTQVRLPMVVAARLCPCRSPPFRPSGDPSEGDQFRLRAARRSPIASTGRGGAESKNRRNRCLPRSMDWEGGSSEGTGSRKLAAGHAPWARGHRDPGTVQLHRPGSSRISAWRWPC